MMAREDYKSMPVDLIPQDSTGTVLEKTIIDNGAALDLSGATGSIFFHARTIGGTAVVTGGSASFVNTGSDGKVEFTLTSAVVGTAPIDLVCEIEVQGYNSGNLITDPFILRITKRAKVA